MRWQSMGDGAGLSVIKGRHMMVCGEWAYFWYVKRGGTAGCLYMSTCPGNVLLPWQVFLLQIPSRGSEKRKEWKRNEQKHE